jgi:Nickel responsive protein SCO4226-like
MPRYLVERIFADGLDIPIDDNGAKTVAAVVATNAEHGVTWVHSYVSDENRRTVCVYDGPSPEAIREVARRNGLPVDAITEVRVLDPYFYGGKAATADVA